VEVEIRRIEDLGDSNNGFSSEQNSLVEEKEKLSEQLTAVGDATMNELLKSQAAISTIDSLSMDCYKARILEDALLEKLNTLEMKKIELIEDIRSTETEIELLETALERFTRLTSINEVFHIWFEGPFGTINKFKLGFLRPGDEKLSSQTDAGLGQAALLMDTIAKVSNFHFRQYLILPLGNFSKIIKADDRGSVFPLHLEQGAFTFFPVRNFNAALKGFMTCIQELGDHVAAYDPTMHMHYKIIPSESKIGDISFTFAEDFETWTRALKFMLADIKWIVAWFTKHHSRDANHYLFSS
jgi:beclin